MFNVWHALYVCPRSREVAVLLHRTLRLTEEASMRAQMCAACLVEGGCELRPSHTRSPPAKYISHRHEGTTHARGRTHPNKTRPPFRGPMQESGDEYWAATAPALGRASGRYYVNRKLRDSPAFSYDKAAQQRLWLCLQRQTGLEF